jgi:hypothetical protein
VDRLTCFTPAAIHAFDLVADMPVIIFLGQLGSCAVRRAPGLTSQFVLLLLWPCKRQVADFNVQTAQLFIDLKVLHIQIVFIGHSISYVI